MTRLEAAIAELASAIREELAATSAPGPERLYSMTDAAARAGIGRTLLYAEAHAGRIRTLKVGRRRLVPASAIDAFIASHETAAPMPSGRPQELNRDRSTTSPTATA